MNNTDNTYTIASPYKGISDSINADNENRSAINMCIMNAIMTQISFIITKK